MNNHRNESTSDAEAALKLATMLDPAAPGAQGFRALLDTLPVFVWIGDEHYNMTYCNKATLEFTGQASLEVVGGGWRETVHPDDVEKHEKTVARAFAERETFASTFRLRRHDGEYFWVSGQGAPLIESDGSFRGYCGVVTDVNELHRARDAERTLRQRLELAADGTTDGMLDWPDVSRPEVWLSNRLLDLLGYTPGELTFTVERLAKLIHPDDVAQVRERIDAAIAAESKFNAEFRMLTRDRGYRWCRGRGSVARDRISGCLRMSGSIQDIEEHRKLELQTQRDQLRTALAESVARVGSWLWNPATGELNWSDEIYRLLGIEPEVRAPIPDDVYKAVAEADRERVREWFREIAHSDEGAFEMEYRVAGPGGQQRVLHSLGRFVADPETGERIIVGTLRDVTAARAALSDLRRFKAMLDATIDGVYLYEADTLEHFYANAGASAYTGYSKDELLQMKAYELNPDLDENSIREAFRDLRAGAAEPMIRTGHHRHKDGRLIPVEVITQYVTTPDDPPAFIAVARDITKRLAHVAEIRELKLGLDGVSDGVFVYDPDVLRFLYVNEGACAYLGYTQEELLGLAPYDVSDGHDEASFRAIVDNLRTGANDRTISEVYHRRKDGTLVPVEVATQLIHPEGQAPRIISIARDITERKNAREALERHQRELENLVAERTQSLRDAQAELIRRERLSTLGQLTATVSHELRNPLATIGPSLYVLKTLIPDTDKRVSAIIERIERNVLRCDHIISDMLDFARQRDLLPRVTDGNACIREQLSDYQPPPGVELTLMLEPGPVAVALDVDSARRALVNIIDNACHAVLAKVNDGAGADFKPEVRLRTRVTDDGYFAVVVEDNGCGMNEEVSQRIFEPLYSTKNFGIGLGMIIVKNIMDRHGGSVEVASVVGEGSTVTLKFPLSESAAGGNQVPAGI